MSFAWKLFRGQERKLKEKGQKAAEARNFEKSYVKGIEEERLQKL